MNYLRACSRMDKCRDGSLCCNLYDHQSVFSPTRLKSTCHGLAFFIDFSDQSRPAWHTCSMDWSFSNICLDRNPSISIRRRTVLPMTDIDSWWVMPFAMFFFFFSSRHIHRASIVAHWRNCFAISHWTWRRTSLIYNKPFFFRRVN